MFFDPRRYDLAKVGRYKFNKKLAFENRIVGHVLSDAVVDRSTGEVLAEAGTVVKAELANAIQDAAIPFVYVTVEDRKVKILSNMVVDINKYINFDAKAIGIHERVYYPVLKELLNSYTNEDELKVQLDKNLLRLIPKHITKEDIYASINYNIHLEYEVGKKDDIDHLGNRRIRAVGELFKINLELVCLDLNVLYVNV
jgi:DNA-directed RNA polymerase subunit beta